MIAVLAAALSLQFEAGVVQMQKPADDTYVEYGIAGHEVEYSTLAFGAGLEAIKGPIHLTVGWRNLGYQKIRAEIVNDDVYFACSAKGAKSACPAPKEFWASKGNEQQVYAEIGYAIRLGAVSLTPSVGYAENIINWHTTITHYAGDCCTTPGYTSITQRHPSEFAGLTVSHGPIGVGLYYLVTDPERCLTRDPAYPGQGKSALYLRLTYNVRIKS